MDWRVQGLLQNPTPLPSEFHKQSSGLGSGGKVRVRVRGSVFFGGGVLGAGSSSSSVFQGSHFLK